MASHQLTAQGAVSEDAEVVDDKMGKRHKPDPMWQRRDKWIGFFEGSFAPHLKPGKHRAGIDNLPDLPWRSGAPASQLEEYIKADNLAKSARVLELGCGSGENLVLLAGHAAYAVGVDIVPQSVEASRCALEKANLQHKGESVCADILDLPHGVPSLQHGCWEFDLIFDCQVFHCLRLIPGVEEHGIARIYSDLLRPGGKLLLLTGSMDEPTARGPERLTKDEILAAFSGPLVCERIESMVFDWTPAYCEQGFPNPPLGWISLWSKA